MTSPENHEATVRFFDEHDSFGLDHVRFFVQGQMPAVDRESGKVLLAEKGQVALSPDGHGGTLDALAAPGPGGAPSCLDEMRERGVRTLFYFQVDNPLVEIADPAFLGLHRQADAEMSFKVIEKLAPRRSSAWSSASTAARRSSSIPTFPPSWPSSREPDGSLELWAGSIAVHVLERGVHRAARRRPRSSPSTGRSRRCRYVDESGERGRARPRRTP